MSSDFLNAAWKQAFPIYNDEGIAASGAARPSKKLVNKLGETIGDTIDEVDASTVKLTGPQTITGVKTFSDGISVPDATQPTQPATKSQLDEVAALVTGASSGEIAFATKADMDADLAHAANVFARVWNDSTASNNRTYVKQGASGSGSWSVAIDRVDTETTRATSVEESIRQIVEVVGVDTPATGTLLGTFTYIWPTPVTRDGSITNFKGFGISGANGEAFKIRVFDRLDDVFTLSGTAYAGTSNVGAIDVDIAYGVMPVKAGQYIGIYAPHQVYVTGPGPGYYSFTGDLDSGTDAAISNTNVAPQVHYEITSYPTTGTNVARLIDGGGETVRLSNIPCVVLGVDSHAAGFYSLLGKSFTSRVSQLCDYRILNAGRPGADILDAAEVLVDHNANQQLKRDLALYNVFAYLAYDMANDNTLGYMIKTKMQYWVENLERFIDTCGGLGALPILILQYASESAHLMAMKEAAAARGAFAYDGGKYGRALGFNSSTNTPNHSYSGHFSPRGNWVHVAACLDVLDSLPEPITSIKIYRHRTEYTVSSSADLLTLDRNDRLLKLEEIHIGERILDATIQTAGLSLESYWDQVDRSDVSFTTYTDTVDEYAKLETGYTLAFDDYVVIRAKLNGTAGTLNSVSMQIDSLTDGATVFVRDWWDVSSSVDGSLHNSYLITSDYLDKHDLPVGAWRELSAFAAGTEVDLGNLRGIMNGSTIEILLYKSDGGRFSEPVFRSYGRGGKYVGAIKRSERRLSSTEMLTNYKFGASLSAYALCSGTPSTFNDPTDPTMYPMDPANPGTRLTYAAKITDTNIVGDTFHFSSSPVARTLRFRVWVRNRVPAFVDLSYAGYSAFNPAYCVDTDQSNSPAKVYPDDSPMRPGTADAALVYFEYTTGTTFPARGGVVHRGLATNAFVPMTIDIPLAEGAFDTDISWKLYTDGEELDVALLSCREILD